MIRHLRRAAVAIAGAAVLVLGGGTVASASIAPPAGQAPAGTTVQRAQDSTSGTPANSVPAVHPASDGGETETVHVPAPGSSASSRVVDLDILATCVSCTDARAGKSSSQGRAVAIRLLGHDVAAGDSESNDKASHGALVDFPDNPLLDLAIADWSTMSHAGDGKSVSRSRAALLDLTLHGPTPADSLLTVSLLESTSKATYTTTMSEGQGVGNALRVTMLNDRLVIILLHSEANSEDPGQSYVLSVNDTKLFTDKDSDTLTDRLPDQLNGKDNKDKDRDKTPGHEIESLVDVPGVLGLLEVSAHGGQDHNVTGTEVDTTPPDDSEGVTPAAGKPPTTGGTTPVGATTPITGGVAGASAANAAAGTSSVPSTGADLGIGGVVLVLAGGALSLLAVRRRGASV